MFPHDVVELANKFIDLQDNIFRLNSENITAQKAYFMSFEPQFISHYLPQIAHYFYFSSIIRQKNIDSYVDLFVYLTSQGNEENELSNLPNYYLDYLFLPPPSKTDITIKIGPISFLRRLYKESVYTIETIIDRIEEFSTKYPKHGNSFLLYFCWFIPEIEQQRSELYSKTLSMFDSTQLLMFPYYFVNFFKKLEDLRADDWKLFEFLTINRYHPSSISYAIANDDTISLQIKLSHVTDINEIRIDCTVFETDYILQNRPTLIQFSMAHNSEKCSKTLIMNHAQLEEHMYERYPTSHFAVASENELALHKLEQEKCNFSGTLNIAAFYHRMDVFEWLSTSLFQNLKNNDFDFGPLIHSCIPTENYSIILHCIEKGININQRDRTKKTFLFEAARSNHQDIVELILSHPDVNVNLHAILLNNSKLIEFKKKYSKNKIPKNLFINHVTPLNIACCNGNAAIVDVLLKMPNIEVNKPNKKIQNKILSCFIIKKKFNRTPLHNAVKHDCPEAVEMLLDYDGIEINPKDISYSINSSNFFLF